MNQYYNIVTTIGTQKIASAITTGTKLNLVTMVIGDGGGSYYEPSVKQTKLKNEVCRREINSVEINSLNPNWLTIEAIIPADIGGFYVREVGVLDSEGNLIVVGKYCETYKPLPSEGTSKELIIRMVIDVDNVESVSLSVNGNISVVTQDEFKSHIHNVNHVFYSVATGTANNYLASVEGITEYFDGLAISLKINAASAGASTLNVNTLGAKQILDSFGNPITSGGLKVGLPYTMRYNGTNFIVQGKGGGGDLIAADLLLGKKATGDSGPVIGSMPNNGAVSANLTNNNQEYTIPLGFHNGLGKIKAVITNLAAAVIKAGTTVGGIVGTFTSDATALASDILSGKTGYVNGAKVTGSMPNLAGVRSATGVAKWGDGALAVYPEKGYQKGGAGDGEIKVSTAQLQSAEPNLAAANMLSGKNYFGVSGGIPLLNPSWSDQKEISNISVGAYSYNNGANYVYFNVPSGNYLNGVNWISHYEPDLLKQFIVAGRTICGIGGEATPNSLGGKKFFSTTVGMSGTGENFVTTNGYTVGSVLIDVSGFDFVPTLAFVLQHNLNYSDCPYYMSAMVVGDLAIGGSSASACFNKNSNGNICIYNGRLRIPIANFSVPGNKNWDVYIFG